MFCCCLMLVFLVVCCFSCCLCCFCCRFLRFTVVYGVTFVAAASCWCYCFCCCFCCCLCCCFSCFVLLSLLLSLLLLLMIFFRSNLSSTKDCQNYFKTCMFFPPILLWSREGLFSLVLQSSDEGINAKTFWKMSARASKPLCPRGAPFWWRQRGQPSLHDKHTRHSPNPLVKRPQIVEIVFPSYLFFGPKLCRSYNECRLEARRNQTPGKFSNWQIVDHVCPNL